jgi:cell division protease FtsH
MTMLDCYVPTEFKAIKLAEDDESITLRDLFFSGDGLLAWVVLHTYQLTDPTQDHSHLTIGIKVDRSSPIGFALETFNDNNVEANKNFYYAVQRAGQEFFERLIDTSNNKTVIDSINTFIFRLSEQISFEYIDGEYIKDTLLLRKIFEPDVTDKYFDERELPTAPWDGAKHTQMDLEPAVAINVDAIINSKSPDIRTFNRRLRLLSNNSVNQGLVDEHVFLAAIFCCPVARQLFKQAMGICGHMQIPRSVHDYISLVREEFQPFLYTHGDDEGKSWFDVAEAGISKLRFTADIAALYKSCVYVESGAINFNHAFIKEAFNINDLDDPLRIIADFVELNNKPLHKRFSTIQDVKINLDEHLVGQLEGKTALTNLFRESLIKDNTNKNSLFLYGSSGVGKTALGKQFAASLEQQGLIYDLNVFNMELYQGDKDAMAIFGSGHFYNAASIGELTSALEFNPNQIIVFDEIEKADRGVVQSLLSVLSERLATDRTTLRRVSFDQCFFIFTSNVGQHSCRDVSKDFLDVNSVLAEHFSSEFISRVKQGEVVHCAPLTSSDIKILANQLANKLRSDSTYFTFNDSLEKAIVLLANELAPRPMQAACSHIESSIWQSIEHDIEGLNELSADMPKTTIDFTFDSSFSIDQLIDKLLGKSWSVNTENVTVTELNMISVNIKIGEPNIQYKHEDVALPFLTIAPKSEVTFSSIIGNEDVKIELKEAINLLHQRSALEGTLPLTPECILLEGEPGSGKTHLARAFANAYKGTFIQVNAADLTIGDAEKNIKSLFEVARRYSPSAIFIDEIDAIAPDRKSINARLAILVNSLLTAFDGFNKDADSPFIIAATNHIDALDPAMIRKGRLGNKLHVQLPTVEVVQKVFKSFVTSHTDTSVLPIDEEHFGKILVNTSMKGIEEVLKKAKNLKLESECSLQQAIYKSVVEHELGKVREDAFIHDNSIKTTAYHEAGHAIAAQVIADKSPIFAVDILPRTNTSGCVLTQPLVFTRAANRQMVDDYICIYLAGRAAEMLLWQDINKLSIGASSDIARATKHALDAISIHGLSSNQTLLDYTQFDCVAREVKHEVTLWLKSAEKRAVSILQKHWYKVEALAEALLVKKTMNFHEINTLLEGVKLEKSPLKNIA